MNEPLSPAAPPEIPDFEDLAADPEIAPLLDFEPAVRKVKRPDGWTPELQRELIARLAATGTLQSAVWQMGKHATGAEALYKVPSADGFRAAWDAAIAIGRRRAGLDCAPPFAGAVPGIQRRKPAAAAPPSEEPEPEPEGLGEDQAFMLLANLGTRFMRKVEAERSARLAGEIVAADFYLRQVTVLEVAFDLFARGQGMDSFHVLSDLRSAGDALYRIVDTPFARRLDDQRRAFWRATPGEAPRPEAFAAALTADRGSHRVAIDQHATGALTPPARGYSEEQWAAMDHDAQRAARERQFEEDARAQVEFERRAHEAWRASEHGARARAAWEQGSER